MHATILVTESGKTESRAPSVSARVRYSHPGHTLTLGIGVDHEDVFVVVCTNPGDPPDRVEELALEARHAFVKHDFLQESHEQDLRISLASVTRLGVVGLQWIAALCNQDHRDALLLAGLDGFVVVVVESSVDLGHVVTLVTVSYGDVGEWLDVFLGYHKILHHAQADIGCRHLGGGDELYVQLHVCRRIAPLTEFPAPLTIPSAMTRIHLWLFG